jgi:hypothetical protein
MSWRKNKCKSSKKKGLAATVQCTKCMARYNPSSSSFFTCTKGEPARFFNEFLYNTAQLYRIKLLKTFTNGRSLKCMRYYNTLCHKCVGLVLLNKKEEEDMETRN